MITQAIDQTRFQPRQSQRRIVGSVRVLAIGLGLGIGLSGLPGTGSEAQAAKISAAATNAPLKYPTYLNDQGHILSGSSTTHSLAAKDKAKAAYVAFKLENGAAISKTVPEMKTKSPLGTAARQAITAVSSGVGKIAVKTQTGTYLVSNYNGKATPSSRRATAAHATASTAKAEPQHLAVKAATPASSSMLNLNNLFNLKAAQASLAASPIGKLLKIDPPTTATVAKAENPPTTTKADATTTTTAPVTTIPITSSLTLIPVGVHEAPVPEPSTFAFAAIAIGGAALRHRLRRRKAASA